jgi:hypothetical protein
MDISIDHWRRDTLDHLFTEAKRRKDVVRDICDAVK